MKSILEDCCSSEWQKFLQLYTKIDQFEARSFIFKEGDSVKGLHIVETGKVKVYTSDGTDKTRLVRLAASGDIIGHRGFGADWKYPITAQALVATSIVFIPLEALNIMTKTNAEFSYNLMMFFAEELRRSENKFKQSSAKARIIAALIENYRAFGFENGKSGKLAYTLSRKDFASKAQTTYETVVRVLSDLNKNRYIVLEGKSIIIKNTSNLEKHYNSLG